MFKIQDDLPKDVFESAAIVVRTTHHFDNSSDQVFDALDSDQAWTWLAPRCGVDYLASAHDGGDRGVGMVREMGTVRSPLRWVWRQRERFVTYEPGRRLTFFAMAATLPVLRQWAEDYVIEADTADSCTLTWTVALTPAYVGRLPLRWTQPILRPIFAVSVRPGLKRLVRRRAQKQEIA